MSRDLEKTTALKNYLNEITNTTVGTADGVTRASKAYKFLEATSYDEIARIASDKFGKVKAIAGDEKIIPLQNVLKSIDEFVAERSSRLAPGDADAAIAAVRKLQQNFLRQAGGPYDSVTSFQNALSMWGQRANTSTLPAFPELSPKLNKQIAGMMYGALMADLEDAANTAAGRITKFGVGSTDTSKGVNAFLRKKQLKEVGTALLDARNTYRDMMTQHRLLKDELLDHATRMLNKNHPELAVFRMLGSEVSDEMVARTLGTVASIDKAAARSMRQRAMEGMLHRARPVADSALGEAGAGISPKRLVAVADKYGPRIKALFADDPGGYAQFQKAVEVSKRLTVIGERNPQKAMFGALYRLPWFRGSVDMVGGGVATGMLMAGRPGLAGAVAGVTALTEIIGVIGQKMNERTIASILSAPEDTRLLLALMNPKTGQTIAQTTRYATLLLEKLTEDN